jgi:hypothetical protein
MVDSVGYIPNQNNTNWQEKGSWNSPARGDHAEIQGWNAMSFRGAPRVCLFHQDGAPCENCSPRFRQLSRAGTTSFIFVVTRPGYSFYLRLDQGDRISGMHMPMGGRQEKQFQEQVIRDQYVNLPSTSLPAALYFHQGSIFLDARPHNFPACPALANFGV